MDNSHIINKRNSIASNIYNTFQDNTLEKGGEGSRGGVVIGHTKSGKPIYDSHGHSSHSKFTSKDHGNKEKVENFKTKSISYEDAESILEEFEESGLVEGEDYDEHLGYGDDIPNAFTAKNEKAQKILDKYDESDKY